MNVTADFTPEQNAALERMHASVLKELEQKPQLRTKSVYSEKNQLARVLVARQFDVPQALEMWRKWVQWRIDYQVDDIRPKNIQHEFRSGKAFLHKHDKLGNPTIIIKIRYHDPEQSNMEDMIRLFTFLMERGIAEAEKAGGTGRLSVIYDREGFTKKNMDSRFFQFVKDLLGMLQDNYAERLDRAYVLNPSLMMRALFGVIRPFLAQKVQNKIKILSDCSQLLEFFDADCLLPEHGGTSTYVYDPVKEYQLDQADDTLDDTKLEQGHSAHRESITHNNDEESYYTMLNDSRTLFANDIGYLQNNKNKLLKQIEDREDIFRADMQSPGCCFCQSKTSSESKCTTF